MPLKGIPSIISPALLHALAAMGHGDEIVLADAHFPTSSICRRGPIEIRADGHKIPELLKAIMQLFPLDTYEDSIHMIEVERFAFYEQAKKAYAIVHTGELAKYGNIIIKKGLAL
eukprot:XP_014780042.1 PREDICTED: fucose mutarotase-like isoform X2 [Octopus bimaculoides]